MADSGVYDRWHKTHPKPGEPRCREHRKVPSAAHGRGRRWQARWRDEAGQQQAKNFTQAADASRFLATVRVEVPGGSFIDPRAGRVLFRDVAEGWRVAQVHRPRSTGPRPRRRSRRTCAATSTPPSATGPSAPSGRPRSRRGSAG
jgi:hypothetical protein